MAGAAQAKLGDSTAAEKVPAAFYLFCAATFLSFLGTSSISYFSVVFAGYGMSVAEIGRIYSSALVPVLLGILFCGSLLTRYSPFQIALVGQAVTLVAYFSFLGTISDPVGALVSRFLVGAGFGLFFPAALIYARTLVSGPNTVFLFGIYATMIPLPNFLGPGLAEMIYADFGAPTLIWSFTAPVAGALLLMCFLPRSGTSARPAEPLGYLTIVRTRSVLLPNAAIVVVGLLWGFMLSFMALYLKTIQVPTAIFFSGATLSMVVSRFTIMAWLGKKPKHLTGGLGLVLMGLGYALLPLCGSNPLAVGTSALVFGFGYSTVFPVLSLWATDQFEPAQRGRAMAVFTAFFQGAIFVVPWTAGAALKVFGFADVVVALAAVSFVVGLYVMTRAGGNKQNLAANTQG
jgi:MFS family permease